MKKREGDPWMSPPDYGRSLRGLGVNMLVRDTARAAAFARDVLGLTVVYADADLAVLRHGEHEWMVHADHTYDAHPLLPRTKVAALRGGVGLPWQRVLGAGGAIKLRGDYAFEQRFRLESEGVTFRGRKVDMKQHEHKFPKSKKKPRVENLDPTLRLDLLASSEQTVYAGNNRNIFVSQAEEVVIPKPGSNGSTDVKPVDPGYQRPTIPPPPPIPLKFYGFASSPGEPKKIFLKQGEDVFVAGEGEIVNRRYKVIRISPTSVEIQDLVNSGPPQSIPLTQG